MTKLLILGDGNMFQDKNILLGIGGGIAVYRIAELARLLVKQGAKVRCVMTRSACEFVTPLTFEALTGEKVYTELFDLTSEREMGHIQLVRWADVVLLAPATSNLIAKITHGIADDLLTTMMQVCEAPVLLAPAMNTSMWESSATQDNIKQLQARGLHILAPSQGMLACGEQGVGRLPELSEICDALLPLMMPQILLEQRWVINAGPTIEPWDAVRVMTNRASGALGSNLAKLAAAMGAEVTLIAGSGTPDAGRSVQRIDVCTGDDMLKACVSACPQANVFIGTAAVSDFYFSEPSTKKIKRGDVETMHVELSANTDIIATIAGMEKRPDKVVAFAAESENHIANAKQKLVAKGVDAVVANDVSYMANDKACGWWITPSSEDMFEEGLKIQFAQQIIEKVMGLDDA
jgi:phosphopantothenoylcysteine decarboxylase/phosphopantothenate--cysteine ligase